MKLTLLRHAIALDKIHNRPDFDRPLTSRGRKKFLKYLEKNSENLQDIDHIICSPSLRTRQTCALVCSMINFDPQKIVEDQRIYDFGASVEEFLSIIKASPSDRKHICFIGHNGSISRLASHLSGEEIHMKKGTIIQKKI